MADKQDDEDPVSIKERAALETWLKSQPVDVAAVIAGRAALRVAPLAGGAYTDQGKDKDLEGSFSRLAAAIFRATALARYASCYLHSRKINRYYFENASEAASFAARVAARVSKSAELAPSFGAASAAAANAAYVAAAPAAPASAAAAAVERAAYAALSYELAHHVMIGGAQDIWTEASKDIAAIEAGKTAFELAAQPLWAGGKLPLWAVTSLGDFEAALRSADHWQVWLDWYGRRLNGNIEVREVDLIFASVPQEIWNEGPRAANEWIKRRLEELGAEVGKDEPSGSLGHTIPKARDLPPPPPIDDVPSIFTYGMNAAGQIDIMAGPQNVPYIAQAGDEETHRRWLDAARKLSERLAKDLRAQKFNANLQYRERLEQYAADLPTSPEDGNIIIADAEARALHRLFKAEASALNEGFAARLSTFLETHFALLAFYEDEMRRFHAAAEKGSLDAPFPREAIRNVECVVKTHTPSVFAARVSEGLKEAARAAPKVELEPEDLRTLAPIQPPPYPFGDADYEKARRLGVGGSINALYKAVLERAKDPEKAAAMIVIAREFYEGGKPIFEYLKQFSGL